MRILLTNDDGVFAPGLAALEQQLRHLGEVIVVAPATEQSGVGHTITFLTPLTCKSIHRDGRHWAWAVDGSPADCVQTFDWRIAQRQPCRLGSQRHQQRLECRNKRALQRNRRSCH